LLKKEKINVLYDRPKDGDTSGLSERGRFKRGVGKTAEPDTKPEDIEAEREKTIDYVLEGKADVVEGKGAERRAVNKLASLFGLNVVFP
tara:strand:- start:6368 stop:6634 length:267 start_codon:yes stop_codon:yes gene_type:complete